MQVTAKLNYLRIAPRKVRLAANLIKRKKIEEARIILDFTLKRSALPLLKLLNSAVANAKNNFHLDENNLYIYNIRVDEGPKNKRWRPRARGRAAQIQKKTSHITLILEEVKPGAKIKKAVKLQAAAPLKKEFSDKTEEAEKPEEKKGAFFGSLPKREKMSEQIKPKPQKGLFKRIFRRKAF